MGHGAEPCRTARCAPARRAPRTCPTPRRHDRFATITGHLGISGAHTHSLRHQFATEALDTDPRELANISPGAGARQHRDHAAVLHPRQRQRRTAHRRDDERPVDRQASPGGEGTAQAHGSAGPDEQGRLAATATAARTITQGSSQEREGAPGPGQHPQPSRPPPAPRRTGPGRKRTPDRRPASPRPPPRPGHGRTRAEDQARQGKVKGREKGASALIPCPGGNPTALFPPDPPSRPRSLRSPEGPPRRKRCANAHSPQKTGDPRRR